MQDKINSSEFNKQTSIENSNYDTGPFTSFKIGRGYFPAKLYEKMQEKQNILKLPLLEPDSDCPQGEHGEEYCFTRLNFKNDSTLNMLNQLGHALNQSKTPSSKKSEELAGSETSQNKSEMSMLTELRQRQRELGLMDNQGNLFDPSTQKWVSIAFMPSDQVTHIQKLYGLDYFERYPEMKNGLPQNSEPNEFLSFRI